MIPVQVIPRFCGMTSVTLHRCCQERATKLHSRYSTTIVCARTASQPVLEHVRYLGLGPTSKDFEEPTQISGPLTKVHANELVLRLNNEERKMLFNALQEFESNRIKEEFEGMKYILYLKYNYSIKKRKII